MKLKYWLLAGVLTTVAAVMLLTALVPQTAEAKGPPSNYRCYYCGTTSFWGGTVPKTGGTIDLPGPSEQAERPVCARIVMVHWLH